MSAAAAARDQLHQLVDLVDDDAAVDAAHADAAALPARGQSPVWAKGLARLQAEETDTPLVLRLASNPFEGEPEMSPIPEEMEERFSDGTITAPAQPKSPGEPEVRRHKSRRRKPSKGARSCTPARSPHKLPR